MQPIANRSEGATPSEPSEHFEWPELLRSTSAPETISTAAQKALANAATQKCDGKLETERELCAQVQEQLGSLQRQRYRVQMTEDEIANVPVRSFSPEN